jgi:serine/threonine-protein kinase
MIVCPNCQTELIQGAKFCPSCGGAVPAGPAEEVDALVGRVIRGNFRIEKLLGTGGMGRVYRALQISLDKPVVLKILHPQFNSDPQLVQRFHREARAASRLNHANSISIIDFGQSEDGMLFMAMEYLQGRDLFTVLQEEFPLAEERLGRVMIQVCSALGEAHAQNIIHRDLKPENIMVEDRRDQKDFVKVLDFGIAKIQDPKSEDGRALTQQGMVCGTPEYMSPEQARGEDLDPRSDVYALGVLMYQMVTGDLPFKAPTAIGIVTKQITEPPLPPRQARPDLPISPEVEAIILKCLEKAADRRFQKAEELGNAWRKLLESRAVQAAMSSSAQPARRGTAPLTPAAPPSHASAPTSPLQGPATEAAVPSAPSLPAAAPAPAVIPLPDAALPAGWEDVAPPRKPVGLLVGLAGVALLVLAGGGYLVTRGGTPAPGEVVPALTPSTAVSAASPASAAPDPAPRPAPPPAAASAEPPAPASRAAAPASEPPAHAPRDTAAERSSASAERASPEPPKPSPKPTATPRDAPDDEDDGSSRAEAAQEMIRRAQKRMTAGDYDEAISALVDARKAQPKDPTAALLLGNAWMAKGEMDTACKLYREFLALAPKDPRAGTVKQRLQACP